MIVPQIVYEFSQNKSIYENTKQLSQGRKTDCCCGLVKVYGPLKMQAGSSFSLYALPFSLQHQAVRLNIHLTLLIFKRRNLKIIFLVTISLRIQELFHN